MIRGNENVQEDFVYLILNYRQIIENGWEDDLQYWCEPTEYHEKRHSVLFITSRDISHEFVRNRGSKGNAFAQESTRYCSYNKDKFGNEITFILPGWITETQLREDLQKPYNATKAFYDSLYDSEKYYFELLEKGWQPQQARQVLSNALKTELVMTCYSSDWNHFFKLRCASNAHSSARELAIPLQEEFIKREYI